MTFGCEVKVTHEMLFEQENIYEYIHKDLFLNFGAGLQKHFSDEITVKEYNENHAFNPKFKIHTLILDVYTKDETKEITNLITDMKYSDNIEIRADIADKLYELLGKN